jgi:hypothetical protein
MPPAGFEHTIPVSEQPSTDAQEAGRIKSIKYPNNPLGKGARDLLLCSAVPQPTSPTALLTIVYLPASNHTIRGGQSGGRKSATLSLNTLLDRQN